MSTIPREDDLEPAQATASPSSGQRPHHLLIAGTGRAGTSFLVRYLDTLGLDTHLSRESNVFWSDNANAGLEDLPLFQERDNLPYVVKSPWIGEFIDQILREDKFTIDAVLIPVRDLEDAASSRVVLELQNIYEKANWMLSMDQTWDKWGVTPGGVIYSLDPVDQERLLAVKFVRLIQSLVRANVKLVLLDFPRIVEDPVYLFSKLSDLLPAGIDVQLAMEAHQRVADDNKVRVSKEREAVSNPNQPNLERETAVHQSLKERRKVPLRQLDLIALRREIARQKREGRDLHSRENQIASLNQRLAEAEAQTASLRDQLGGPLAEAQAQISSLGGQLAEAHAQISSLGGQSAEALAEISSLMDRLAQSQAYTSNVEGRLHEQHAHSERLQASLDRYHARSLRGVLHRLRGRL
jgi:ferritin-like metal-binding protein YciE